MTDAAPPVIDGKSGKPTVRRSDGENWIVACPGAQAVGGVLVPLNATGKVQKFRLGEPAGRS